MFGQKKYASALAILLLYALTALTCRAEAFASLGIPEGWQCGEPRSAEFSAVSGSQGFWIERDYRTSDGFAIKATLMTGKGPGTLYVPPLGTDSAEGPLGSGGEYKTLTVGECRALFERLPFRGVVLAISTDLGVLTLESPSEDLDCERFVSAAGLLVSCLKDI
jgi:hypothetical protein